MQTAISATRGSIQISLPPAISHCLKGAKGLDPLHQGPPTKSPQTRHIRPHPTRKNLGESQDYYQELEEVGALQSMHNQEQNIADNFPTAHLDPFGPNHPLFGNLGGINRDDSLLLGGIDRVYGCTFDRLTDLEYLNRPIRERQTEPPINSSVQPESSEPQERSVTDEISRVPQMDRYTRGTVKRQGIPYKSTIKLQGKPLRQF